VDVPSGRNKGKGRLEKLVSFGRKDLFWSLDSPRGLRGGSAPRRKARQSPDSQGGTRRIFPRSDSSLKSRIAISNPPSLFQEGVCCRCKPWSPEGCRLERNIVTSFSTTRISIWLFTWSLPLFPFPACAPQLHPRTHRARPAKSSGLSRPLPAFALLTDLFLLLLRAVCTERAGE